MAKLSFDYDGNEQVAEYRGLTIRVVRDEYAENPWQDSDGMTPLIWYSESLNDESGAYDIESPLKSLSDYQLGRRWRELCAALDCDADELDSYVKEEQKAYGGRLADYRRDRLESTLSDMRPDGSRSWGAACDYFDALETLWRLAGVEALDFQRNGYSQGDSVRGLLVALPQWREAMGIEPSRDMRADLEAQADLFGAWVFGDCYGYVIESPSGETLDSCFGFIGDPETSGLAEAATSTADYILSAAAKRRAERLKELIRARVPAALRPAILTEAGKLESA